MFKLLEIKLIVFLQIILMASFVNFMSFNSENPKMSFRYFFTSRHKEPESQPLGLFYDPTFLSVIFLSGTSNHLGLFLDFQYRNGYDKMFKLSVVLIVACDCVNVLVCLS